jgi:hypothetical protein
MYPHFVILATGFEAPAALKNGEIALSVLPCDICFAGDISLSSLCLPDRPGKTRPLSLVADRFGFIHRPTYYMQFFKSSL